MRLLLSPSRLEEAQKPNSQIRVGLNTGIVLNNEGNVVASRWKKGPFLDSLWTYDQNYRFSGANPKYDQLLNEILERH